MYLEGVFLLVMADVLELFIYLFIFLMSQSAQKYFLDKQHGNWVGWVEHALPLCRKILKLESWKCTSTGLVNL